MGDWRAQGQNARRRQGAPSHHAGGAAPDRPTSLDFVPESRQSQVREFMAGTANDPIAEAHLHLGEAKRLKGLKGKLPDGAIHTNRVAQQNAAARARRGY